MSDGHALASTLEPVLREACRGRLSPVRWFKATWQHGGASTGYAEWTTGAGRKIECVVKLPVGYPEYAWTKRLGLTHERDWDEPDAVNLPTPRVLAGGFELGNYDFAWLVMERFPGHPIGARKMDGGDVWALFETTAEFHAAAVLDRPVDTEAPPREHDWADLLDRAGRMIEEGALADGIESPAAWACVLDRTRDALPSLLSLWDGRPLDTWCHRDVHAHNAMRRAPMNGGRGPLALMPTDDTPCHCGPCGAGKDCCQGAAGDRRSDGRQHSGNNAQSPDRSYSQTGCSACRRSLAGFIALTSILHAVGVEPFLILGENADLLVGEAGLFEVSNRFLCLAVGVEGCHNRAPVPVDRSGRCHVFTPSCGCEFEPRWGSIRLAPTAKCTTHANSMLAGIG